MLNLRLQRPRLLISLCLVVLIVSAIFLRFYHFKDTYLFLGDQGRDALIVAGIFKDHNLVFIGPVTSIGNLYLGPFYYYFMVPFLMLTYPSPLGPGIAVALISILTVYLMYQLGQELVGKRAALLAAFFYAFSAEVVRYSRFSWNPNITAPVTLLLLWSLWRAWKKNPWYWLGVSICFSILIQLHYMTLTLLGGLGIVWLIQLRSVILSKKTTIIKTFLVSTVLAGLIFVASLTPLILFNYRHNGLIVKAFTNLIFTEKAIAPEAQSGLLPTLSSEFQLFISRSVAVIFGSTLVSEVQIGLGLLIITGLSLAILLQKKFSAGVGLLLSLLVPCLVGFAFYHGSLFVHYFLFVFPIVFLVWGWVLANLTRQIWGWLIVAAVMTGFLVFNVTRMPLQGNGVTTDSLSHFSQEILTHLKPDEKYALLLLSPTKDYYGSNYRYFMTADNHPPVAPELESEASTLVVINEDAVANVPKLDIYEINIFPNKVPSEVYTIPNGPQVIIFRK